MVSAESQEKDRANTGSVLDFNDLEFLLQIDLGLTDLDLESTDHSSSAPAVAAADPAAEPVSELANAQSGAGGLDVPTDRYIEAVADDHSARYIVAVADDDPDDDARTGTVTAPVKSGTVGGGTPAAAPAPSPIFSPEAGVVAPSPGVTAARIFVPTDDAPTVTPPVKPRRGVDSPRVAQTVVRLISCHQSHARVSFSRIRLCSPDPS